MRFDENVILKPVVILLTIIASAATVFSCVVGYLALFRTQDLMIILQSVSGETASTPQVVVITVTPANILPTLNPSATPTATPALTSTPTLRPTETPIPPATDTPMPTSQPTPIPISSVRILFQDDFSNPNRGWKSAWGTRGIYYEDGRLVLESYAYPGLQFEDFVLEVEAQNITDKPSARMGVSFRAHPRSGDWAFLNEYYGFSVGDDGTVALVKDESYLYLVQPKFHPATSPPGEMNRIHIEALKGRFRFFVNDQFVYEYEDSDYGDRAVGDIGLYVGDPNNVDVRVAFDNFVVGLLEGWE